MRVTKTLTGIICTLAMIAVSALAFAQAAGEASAADQHVAAIKQNLAQSHQNIKQYKWTETTVMSYKGEEKSKTVNSCSYGADGKVVKTVVSAPAPAEEKRGVRGKVAENKKEEISTHMQSSVALIKSYIPLDPAKIQACKDAGKMSMTVVEPGKRARIDFKDYEKPGDILGIEIDPTTNQILGLSVASYLADAKDVVKLNVVMAALPDGTSHPATITMDTPAADTSVAITNSAYEKKAN